MPELLGVVVLYYPDEKILERVGSYLNELTKLLVIDNSVPSSAIAVVLTKSSSKVELIVNGANLGIAHALNQAIAYAIQNKYQWVLTMDQDSQIESGALKIMKDHLSTASPDIGIFAPRYLPQRESPHDRGSVNSVPFVMTSGSVVNTRAAVECELFDEKLFIDSVDHEFCLRIRKKGNYRILRLNDALFAHSPGEVHFHRLFLWELRITHHPPERKYYMTRNRLYLISRYYGFDPSTCVHELNGLLKSLISIFLFENHKAEKLKATFRGARDFLRGRYGKYEP